MALLDEARAESGVPGPRCDIEKIVLPHGKADEILAVIRDREISSSAAARTFNRHNIAIGRATIERHRTNDCGCCRRAGRVF